ncbi:MAG: hypothetical protein J6M30_01960 [Bacteroidales bacterium]|nr:hypothetical protein [Bacteroidales bacterium]
MEQIIEITESIERNIKRLVSEKKSLETELSGCLVKIDYLQNQITELERENRELKLTQNTDNLTNIINNHSDIAESKLIINGLLDIINKSISIIKDRQNG